MTFSSPPYPVQPLDCPPSTRPASLLEAIAAARPSFGSLEKDSENSYVHSKYLKLPTFYAKVTTALLEQGVAIYSRGVQMGDGSWAIRTTLSLVDGSEELESDYPIILNCNVDSSDGKKRPNVMFAISSFFTIGVRYNLYALLAVCPHDADTDGSYEDASAGVVGPAPLPGMSQAWQAASGAYSTWRPGQVVQGSNAYYSEHGGYSPNAPAQIANFDQSTTILQ